MKFFGNVVHAEKYKKYEIEIKNWKKINATELQQTFL